MSALTFALVVTVVAIVCGLNIPRLMQWERRRVGKVQLARQLAALREAILATAERIGQELLPAVRSAAEAFGRFGDAMRNSFQ